MNQQKIKYINTTYLQVSTIVLTIMVSADFKRFISPHKNSVNFSLFISQNFQLSSSALLPLFLITVGYISVQLRSSAVSKRTRSSLHLNNSYSLNTSTSFTYSCNIVSSFSSRVWTSIFGKFTRGSKWISGLAGAS